MSLDKPLLHFNLKNNSFYQWLLFKKRIIIMRLTAQSSIIINAEKGGYYLRRGTNYQVGQPIKIPIPGTTKIKTRYISNMFFNFKSNSITASFVDRPIKGLTELFNDK